jgi:hypothetical protein
LQQAIKRHTDKFSLRRQGLITASFLDIAKGFINIADALIAFLGAVRILLGDGKIEFQNPG